MLKSVRVGLWRRLRTGLLAPGAAGLLLVVAGGHTEASPAAQPCQFASPVAIVLGASTHNLGCSTSDPFMTAASEQPFEHGSMLWLQEWGIISVLREDGGYDGFEDQYSPDKPASAGLVPPSPELQEPTQGFGEIWRKLGGPAAPLGWAVGPETSYVATVQYFERGAIIQRADRSELVLTIFNHARGQWAVATVTPPSESGR